jgi:DNA mismatch repair ATPase MutS
MQIQSIVYIYNLNKGITDLSNGINLAKDNLAAKTDI